MTGSGSVLSDLPHQLTPFVRDGRISAMPAKRSKRLLLLDRVAQAFEPGRHYSERAVDEILKGLFDDHATLRRYLIDEELLDRTPDGTYWRAGGTVPVSLAASHKKHLRKLKPRRHITGSQVMKALFGIKLASLCRRGIVSRSR